MSASPPSFLVTLHHLAPDAKSADAGYPDLPLASVSTEKLHALIGAMAALARRDIGEANPELRITAPHGRFTVQVSEGQLRFNSWTTRVGGFDLNAEQIFAIVAGLEDPAPGSPMGGRNLRWLRLAVLVVLIVGTNAITAWMLTRPPAIPLLPEFRPLEPEPGNRLLAEVAGDYQTGTAAGDRGLKIYADGRMHWVKFGANGTVAEESDIFGKPVDSRGKPALFANGNALVEIADGSTLKFYGDTYRRKLR